MKKARGKREMWWWAVLTAWCSLFSLGLLDNARGPVFPDLLKEYDLSDTAGAFFFSVVSVSGLLHNILFYRYISTTPAERLVGVYTSLMAVGGLLVAIAPNFSLTLVACVVLGAGFGGLGVGQNVAVQNAPEAVRGKALGILHAMYGLSSFLAPLVVSGLTGALFGLSWRWVFFIMALPALLLGGFVAWHVRSLGEVRETPKEFSNNGKPPSWSMMAVAACLVAMLVVAETSISTRLVLLARRDWGVSLDTANLWLSFYFAMMMVSRFALGFASAGFSERFSVRKQLAWSIALCVPLAVLGLISLWEFMLSRDFQLLALGLYGFPIGLCYPLAMNRIATIFGAGTQRVTSLCILLQSGFSMGMHLILGSGADHIGLQKTLVLVAVGSLFVAGFSHFLLEKNALKATRP